MSYQEEPTMSTPPETIVVEVAIATGEIADLLDRADHHPLILKRNGRRYLLSREIESPDDVAAKRATLFNFAGFLSDEDATEMKEYLRRGREEGSRWSEDSATSDRHGLEH